MTEVYTKWGPSFYIFPQILQRHFPKDSLSQQRKTQTSLHVRATESRATGARYRRRRICKSNLLKWKHWPSREGGTHEPRQQNRCNFLRYILLSVSETKEKVFPKRKKNFLKRKCFYLENICEMKVFSKRK